MRKRILNPAALLWVWRNLHRHSLYKVVNPK